LDALRKKFREHGGFDAVVGHSQGAAMAALACAMAMDDPLEYRVFSSVQLIVSFGGAVLCSADKRLAFVPGALTTRTLIVRSTDDDVVSHQDHALFCSAFHEPQLLLLDSYKHHVPPPAAVDPIVRHFVGCRVEDQLARSSG
jgi:hypothetical protein